MVQRHTDPSDNLDVAAVARRKIQVFGLDARAVMLARAENFRRHGDTSSAAFWQAVADAVAAMSDPVSSG